jgi:hypothetical protein
MWLLLSYSAVGEVPLTPSPTLTFPKELLTPIPPYGTTGTTDRYEQIVFDTLIGNRYCDVWMIVRPCFTREFAVLITRKLVDGMPMDKLPFEVQLVLPEQMIRRQILKLDGKMYVDPLKNVPVARETSDISDADANSFITTWFRGLREVRYDDPPAVSTLAIRATDGTSYDFHASERYEYERYGQTYAPTDGVALVMTQSGECLVRYVKASLKERENVMQDCRKINDKLMELTKK